MSDNAAAPAAPAKIAPQETALADVCSASGSSDDRTIVNS
jgi:hypothetical protein